MTEPLFGAEPAPRRSSTTGERRRARHAVAVAHGQHPLAVSLGCSVPLHPDADHAIPATHGPQCGGCTHRRTHNGATARSYPKCVAGGDPAAPRFAQRHPRITHGPGTDVLASWPACTDYQPKEAR